MKRFEELPVQDSIKKAVRDLKYTELFPIQAQAILPMLQGRDVIGQAHTGTGKTAAFAIPILERLQANRPGVQCLVLTPTRELADQVCGDFNKLAKYLRFRAVPVFGGEPIERQIDDLRRGPQIVVGTPGRILDHLSRGTLDLRQVTFLVLDEADRMLDMGFIEDIERIIRHVPKNRQTALFSATMPKPILRLAERYMNPPEVILVDKDEISLNEINQYYMIVDQREKLGALIRILKEPETKRALIFCATKIGARRLHERLQERRFRVMALHGDLRQNQRNRAIQAFKEGRVPLLIATDVAARGLDIQDVTHIINYDVPNDPLNYFHRIGRTARAGKSGVAITFITPNDRFDFGRIQSMTKADITNLGKTKQESAVDQGYYDIIQPV